MRCRARSPAIRTRCPGCACSAANSPTSAAATNSSWSQPKLDHTQLEPGGAATEAIRDAASKLEFVKSGDARVRITGNVALADEEFASVAQGAATGLIGSIAADRVVAVSWPSIPGG